MLIKHQEYSVYKNIIIIIFCLAFNASFADKNIKLHKSKLFSKNDSIRAAAYLNLGIDYNELNMDSSKYFLNKAIQLCRKNNYIQLLIISEGAYSLIEVREGNLQKGITRIEQAIKKANENNITLKLSELYSQLSQYYLMNVKYEKAYDCIEKAREIDENNGDSVNLAKDMVDLGLFFMQISSDQDCINVLLKAIQKFKKLKIKDSQLGYAYLYISMAYENLGNIDSTIKCLFEAKNIFQFNNNLVPLSGLCARLTKNHIELGQFEEAQKYSKEGIRLAQSSNSFQDLQFNLIYRSAILNHQKKYLEAEQILENILKAYEQDPPVSFKNSLYKELKKIYENTNRIKQALAITDSLYNWNCKEIINEQLRRGQALEIKGRIKEKQKEIELLNLKNQQAEKEKVEQKKITLGIGIGFIVTIAIIIFIIVLLRKNKKQKNILQQAFNKNNILLKEIHHRVKNNLQMISTLLELQSKNSHNKEALEILKSGQNRVKSIALIHQKLYQNEDISKVDFKEYVEQLVKYIINLYEFENKKINVNLTITSETFVDIDQAIPLSLILNELLTNSYKYAFPIKNEGNIIIKLVKINNQFCFEYSDDGKGFSLDSLKQKEESLGMKLIRILSRQLQGKAEWKTEGETKYLLTFTDVTIEKVIF